MHKTILMLLLAVVSSNSMAEWVYVTKTSEKIADAEAYTAYADPDTIRRKGNKVDLWVLYDFKSVFDGDTLSAKLKQRFDCKKKQRMRLFVAYYSRHMAEGETVLIDNRRDYWFTYSANSIIEAMLEFACRFRPTPLTFPEETFS